MAVLCQGLDGSWRTLRSLWQFRDLQDAAADFEDGWTLLRICGISGCFYK